MQRSTKLQWLNHLASTHDLLCKCDHPLKHTVNTIFEIEPELKKECLTTQEDGGDVDTIDGLGDGELEALFAQDEKEDTG